MLLRILELERISMYMAIRLQASKDKKNAIPWMSRYPCPSYEYCQKDSQQTLGTMMHERGDLDVTISGDFRCQMKGTSGDAVARS